jgi:hypothetical protein
MDKLSEESLGINRYFLVHFDFSADSSDCLAWRNITSNWCLKNISISFLMTNTYYNELFKYHLTGEPAISFTKLTCIFDVSFGFFSFEMHTILYNITIVFIFEFHNRIKMVNIQQKYYFNIISMCLIFRSVFDKNLKCLQKNGLLKICLQKSSLLTSFTFKHLPNIANM